MGSQHVADLVGNNAYVRVPPGKWYALDSEGFAIHHIHPAAAGCVVFHVTTRLPGAEQRHRQDLSAGHHRQIGHPWADTAEIARAPGPLRIHAHRTAVAEDLDRLPDRAHVVRRAVDRDLAGQPQERALEAAERLDLAELVQHPGRD